MLRRFWLPLLAISVALLLLLARNHLSTFDWRAFALLYHSIDWYWMSSGMAIVLASYIARALRWQVMLHPLAPNAPFTRVLSATMIGFTAIVLLGRPGELVRPYLIAKNEKVSVSSQMAIWLLERIYDLLAVLLLFGLGLITFDSGGRNIGTAMQWVLQTGGFLIAALCAACLTFLIFAARGGDAMVRRLQDALGFLPEHLLGRVSEVMRSFATGLASCRDGAGIGRIVAYTILEWGAIVAACYCIFQSFPQTAVFGWLDVIVYLGFVSFGSIVQIPGIGGGVQIVSAVVLTQLFGVEAAPAAGIAIASWAATWVVVIPFGLFLAARQGVSWASLKHIDEEVKA